MRVIDIYIYAIYILVDMSFGKRMGASKLRPPPPDPRYRPTFDLHMLVEHISTQTSDFRLRSSLELQNSFPFLKSIEEPITLASHNLIEYMCSYDERILLV